MEKDCTYLSSNGLTFDFRNWSLMSEFIHSSWLFTNSMLECATVVSMTIVYFSWALNQ